GSEHEDFAFVDRAGERSGSCRTPVEPNTKSRGAPAVFAGRETLDLDIQATDPTQIWMCDFDSESGVLGGKPHQVTEISTGADGGIWSPDGKNIVFVSAVYPDCKDAA